MEPVFGTLHLHVQPGRTMVDCSRLQKSYKTIYSFCLFVCLLHTMLWKIQVIRIHLPWGWTIGYGCGTDWFGYIPTGCDGYLKISIHLTIKNIEIGMKHERKQQQQQKWMKIHLIEKDEQLNQNRLPWLWLWHWIAYNCILWWISTSRCWNWNRCCCHYHRCCEQTKQNQLFYHFVSIYFLFWLLLFTKKF